MFLYRLLIYPFIFKMISCQFTYKSNEILSRKKRYLSFPEGSNFVVTGSAIKNILLNVPTGFITLLELDVLFKLPTAEVKKIMKQNYYHFRQRREVFSKISKIIEMYGFDGNSCIEKTICEAKKLSLLEDDSLFKHLIVTIFSKKYTSFSNEDCNGKIISKCDFSLLSTILYHIYEFKQ